MNSPDQPDPERDNPPPQDAATASYGGLRVAGFESRRAAELERMIARFGGVPSVSPSMREVPLERHEGAIEYAHQLITGGIDVTIFLTGVGFRHLLTLVEAHVDRERFLNALTDTVTIARGPKPVAALKEVGITPTWRVPAPNTWREVLTTIDQHVPISNQHVALQEYGKSNTSLIAGLEARGARVAAVRIYRWALPEDLEPLKNNLRRLAAGELDLLLFTSAQQVYNMLEVAQQLELADKVLAACQQLAVGSIGPTTSEALRDCGLPVDFEPVSSKMGQLVRTGAERIHAILRRKRREPTISPATPSSPPDSAPWYNSPFMKACRREPVPYTPVWLMRQAGRYMAEYRDVRAQTTFLELCKNPALCSEVMCTAVDRLGVDAAIIFSDLLPILEPMGFDLEFAHGEGPVIHNPVRQPPDVARVRELESMEQLDFVVETVRQTRRDLPAELPLIGFAGAPFTLASYAIEGGASRNYLRAKSLMYQDPAAWNDLLGRFSRAVVRYLKAQVDAGAQVVQLFDSWVGCLGPEDYRDFVLPHMQYIVSQLVPHAPVISFATGNPALLPLLAEAGPTVVGVDWRIRLADAWDQLGDQFAVQGNLDPIRLMGSVESIREAVQSILEQAGGRPGHIFNLGHGILPQTPVENAIALVEAVHELSAR